MADGVAENTPVKRTKNGSNSSSSSGGRPLPRRSPRLVVKTGAVTAKIADIKRKKNSNKKVTTEPAGPDAVNSDPWNNNFKYHYLKGYNEVVDGEANQGAVVGDDTCRGNDLSISSTTKSRHYIPHPNTAPTGELSQT